MRAPLMFLPNPGIIGSISSTAPMRKNVHLNRASRWALDDEQGQHERPDRHQAPQLLCRELVVEARDHHVPDAVQQHDQREQRAVGATREDPHGDVGDADQHQHERRNGPSRAG